MSGRSSAVLFRGPSGVMPDRRFRNQHFDQLRKKCLKKRQLFVDTEFPPTNSSLFLEQGRSSDIVWKRPAELHADPHLFVEGASANDVTQGILGNCWFVSACSALTHNQALLDRVIPFADSQEWVPKRPYAGIFRFRFWRFGQWVEVVIDDLLPTREGKLLFARSKTPNEFWSALLEKAFAKLYGCYENLVGGHLSDALQDVSGGVAETLNLSKLLKQDPQDKTRKLYNYLKLAFDHSALIVAAIAARTKEEIEQTLDCGLVKGHAYAVTAIRAVELDAKTNGMKQLVFGHGELELLIRLQNPWGEKEWNGAWSDGSKEWEQVTESQKAELGITIDEDGDFWMPWNAFIQYFTDVSLCQLLNTSFLSFSKRYHESIFFGEWTTNGAKSGAPDDLSGGCLNFAATFCNNPQYAFNVYHAESDIMFALTQKEMNEGEKRRDPYVTIGMHVMKVEENRVHRVHQPMEAISTSDYANARSVFMHLRDLKPGRYVLLPTTFAPREQTTFMLRVYSDHDIHLRSLTKHAPRLGLFGCKNAENVTRITITEIILNGLPDAPYYCILFSGKTQERTQSKKSEGRIRFDVQYVFHRSSMRQPYILELWEDVKFGRDRLIGKAKLTALIDNDTKDLTIAMSDSSGLEVAKAVVAVSAFDDPMYL